MKNLCITLGDPCGLGPELVCRHFTEHPPLEGERLLLIGPKLALDRELERLGAPAFFSVLKSPEALLEQEAGAYLYEPPQLARLGFPLGKAVVEGGLAAGVSLDAAIETLKAGICHGLLTCPLNKAMLRKAGFAFPGHTEFLAEKLGVGRDNVCMHLCGHDPENPQAPMLRVSLATTHPPLCDVPGMISRERILRCLRLTAAFTARLGLDAPIAVCGLNPHAGESGCIGSEEGKTIIPAIEAARAEGMNVEGPFPGDTIFHFAARGQYSAVLAMYHDQGLAPLKLAHFSQAVNVTLGLPYPRTSPDHGTGYDIAGTGKASTESFHSALDMVRLLTERQDG